MDDHRSADADGKPRYGLPVQIIRAIALAALITGVVWIATSYALDWLGPTFR